MTLTRRLPNQVAEALWEAVARGLVTSDGFDAVRTLLHGRAFPPPVHRRLRTAGTRAAVRAAGRWSLIPATPATEDADELAEALAEQLLARWGVVFRDLLVRETFTVPWREVLWALRRMEARGTIRGGRFVTGFTGEQYALPEALEVLRTVRKEGLNGQTVILSAADPLNLVGVVVPGARVPAVATNHVALVDGVPADALAAPA
jgi:ATP-dependent Lhr-like helicase